MLHMTRDGGLELLTNPNGAQRTARKRIRSALALILSSASALCGWANAASPPTASMVFVPTSIDAGATAAVAMQITISNPNAQALNGVGFFDQYPTGMANNGTVIGECGGSVDATQPSTLTLSGATIPANGNCVIYVQVHALRPSDLSVLPYLLTNSTGSILSSNAPSGTAATASLLVNPPVVEVGILPEPPVKMPTGTVVSFPVKISNHGPEAADGSTFFGTQLVDFTATDVTCDSETGGAVCPANPTIAAMQGSGISIPTLPAGGAVTFTVTGTSGGIGAASGLFQAVAPAGAIEAYAPDNQFIWNADVGPAYPVLELTKSSSASQFGISGGSSYSISVKNVGSAPTNGDIVVTDSFSSGVSYQNPTGSDSGWLCGAAGSSPLTCTYSGLPLPPGGSTTLKLNIGVNAFANTADNTATVTGGGDGECQTSPAPARCSSTVLVSLTNKPALAISKTASASTFIAGAPASYTIAIQNTGGINTTAPIVIDDTLPPGVTLADTGGSDSGWTCPPPAVHCQYPGPLASGATTLLKLNVTVSTTATTGDNTASVSGGGDASCSTAPIAPHCSDTVLVSVAHPDLEIHKSHVGNFHRGQIGAEYTLTVSNVGAAPTTGAVTVHDVLPTGLVLKSAEGAGAWGCSLTPTPPTWTVDCTQTDPLPAGQAYPPITLTVDVASNAPASVVNTATVTNAGDANPANDSASDPTTIGAAVVDLEITKTHIGNFSQGQIGAQYTITIGNVGGAPTAGQVTMNDALPADLTATGLSGVGWSCSLTTMSCKRSNALASGQSYPPITLTVNVAPTATNLVNTASLTNAGDTNSANDTATDPTSIGPAAIDLKLLKSHVGNFAQGQIGAQYTLTVSSVGGATTNGLVTVHDALPSGLTATAMSGPGWNCALATLDCTRSDALPSGQSYPLITLTVDVAGNAPANVTNTATVANAGDTNTANDTAIDPTTIGSAGADLAIAKQHAGNFSQGQTGAQYTITVNNAGGASTSGTVTVTDALPTGLTATSLNGTGWTCTLGTLTCSRSDALPSGQAYPPITLTVDVADNAPANVTNTATLTNAGDANAANNTASDPTTIDGSASTSTVLAADDAMYVHAATTFDTATPTSSDRLHNGYRSVLANDRPQGLLSVKETDPSRGSLTLNQDGTFVYVNSDAPTVSGTDSFTYKACLVSNPTDCSLAATVTINIVPQTQILPPPDTDPPIAVDDAAIVAPGGSLDTSLVPPTGSLIGGLGSVLDNDLGSGLHAMLISPPSHIGTPADFRLDDDGHFYYKNNHDGESLDAFAYQACTDEQVCAGAVVTFSIVNGATDEPPVVVDDLLQVAPGVTLDTTPLGGDVLVGGASSLLENDTDADAAAGELTAALLSLPVYASAPPFVLNPDGTLVYESDVAANDTFIYEACDAYHACTAGIVSAWVTTDPTDHAPVANDDQMDVAVGGVANVLIGGATSLLANDTDEDAGETATLTAHHLLGSGPSHGSVAIQNLGSPNGTFIYTNDGTGSFDSFQYEACDIHGACVAATVWIDIGGGSAPTVSCQLAKQVFIAEPTGTPVDIDLTALFVAPTGQNLAFSFTGLPVPPFSVDPNDHLVAMLLGGDAGIYQATLIATNAAPPLLSASEDVTFEVIDRADVLLRDGFDSGTSVSQPCP